MFKLLAIERIIAFVKSLNALVGCWGSNVWKSVPVGSCSNVPGYADIIGLLVSVLSSPV